MAVAPRYHFASDNYAGICPEAWAAMAEVNSGFAPSYGADLWTAQACDLLRDFFAADCQVFFVFNGTAANSLALSSLCRSYHSIICHDLAHIETDECGAPEFFSNGTKLLHIPGDHGKVDLAAVAHTVQRRSDIHYPKPRVLSLTQATELGTVYTPAEVAAAGALCRQLDLKLHMDGARFANALVTLGCTPAELSWRAGVDVLTFGGTKAGMAVGEAVIFFNKGLAEEFDYRCKQAGQLASKMRFLSAPWIGMLRDGAMLRHAAHANVCARKLAVELAAIPGVRIVHPCEADAVFVALAPTLIDALRGRGWHFYTFIGSGQARFMCSWNTTFADVEALVADVRELAAG
ncbi:MAG: threonine aldolase [Desulfuromonadales bacterium GWD2_61_12]|nr:MAG: threonine aldolase [Desulfuromonadales bacterium GWC2_61_20]OGR33619.1 MAG: threonine aldolase [Desulfuromonadales bacterium GWD2_61_12]HAD03125.1 threonine aldolase [Desulfuromonas sp.]HBT82874.1 threonine aldolase [Desulfuromonas sp.]